MTTQAPRVAIITGSSRGIGASIAKRLAANRITVIVNYAGRAADADQVVADITAQGGKAVAIQADVSVPAQVAALFDQATALFGGVDILVNSAGTIQPGLTMLADTDDNLFDRLVSINLKGTFNTLRVAASSGFGLMAAQSLARADRVRSELLRRVGLEGLLSPSHELPSGRI
jgi:3-oxoacyl-[acyl-carrier protein] reductase